MNTFFVENKNLFSNIKEGRKEFVCKIENRENGLLWVECPKCKIVCKHLLELSQHFLEEETSLRFMDTIWFYDKVTLKTLAKAWNVLSKTRLDCVEFSDFITGIVDGNNDTYAVAFEDGKRYCSCIYGKRGQNLCYHQAAILLAAIQQKGLSIQEVKALIT